MQAPWLLILSWLVNLLTSGVDSTIVKDASLSNVAMQTARKSNPATLTEFQAYDVIFVKDKPRRFYELIRDLSRVDDARHVKINTKNGMEVISNYRGGAPEGVIRLYESTYPMTLLDIAKLLRVRKIYFIRPTVMNIGGNTMPISQVIDIYATDLKASIMVRYINNDEVFFYDNERISATQLYNIIFQRPNFIFDFCEVEMNSIKLPFTRILYTVAYVPNLYIINQDRKFTPLEFIHGNPNFRGKIQVEFNSAIGTLVEVIKQALKYSIADYFTLPKGLVHPYYALMSLQNIPELMAWRPGPGRKPIPTKDFISDVFPDEDPKQNIIQILVGTTLLSISDILKLLFSKGTIIFGDMGYAGRIPEGDYQIKTDNHTFTPEAFLETYGKTSEYYEIMEGSRILTMEEVLVLTKRVPTKTRTTKALNEVTMFGVPFSHTEIAYNLALQKPRHIMIYYNNNQYTPEQFIEVYRNHIPTDFVILQNGIEVQHRDVFKIIDINATPQFLQAYQVVNTHYNGQIYTKDDILTSILEKPDGFTILDNGQFRTPLNFKEHYGDNIPGYGIYYRNKPVKPEAITEILDLEQILEKEFYPILYNGNSYSPKDVVRMLYNQQPDRTQIVHKEKKYTPEEYIKYFPSTKFQVLFNDYPMPASDLEKIIDFDMKSPKSPEKFLPVKYKGVTYSKEDIIDILIKQAPPNVKILHEGFFYQPKQFKRQFGNNMPINFAIVQYRQIIPSKLLPYILKLGDFQQTNPKIFPNLFYGGKEYTPDDILDLIIKQNHSDVTIAIRDKKYTPIEFQQHYDGIYPITFSILFKNMVIKPEDIMNIVDFDLHTTEPPRVVISNPLRGQDVLMASRGLTTRVPYSSSESDTYEEQSSSGYVENDENHDSSIENVSELTWMNNYPGHDGIPVKDTGPSNEFQSKQFPYVIHNGALFTPVDVVKSLIANISTLSSHKWSIYHRGIEYVPSDFLKEFETLPGDFQIYKDDLEIKPEHIPDYLKLINHGFTINEKSGDGSVFPHLVYNGVIFTPHDILKCLIQGVPEDTYILHNNRVYRH